MSSNRQLVVDTFCREPGFNVLILSHDVGGVGLNIVEANHVFHYTRPWNPAKENQATDRVHRIGQKREVFVYLPTVTHEKFQTVEEKLSELLSKKSALARDVLRPTKDLQVKLDDLLEVFQAPAPESSRTEDGPQPKAVIDLDKLAVEEGPKQPVEEAPLFLRQDLGESEFLDPRRSPISTVIDVNQRQVGISFEKLFRPYLVGARQVELADPFLRYPYQFRILREFSNVACLLGTIKKLKIITRIDEPEEKNTVTAELESLKSRLERWRVELEYRFDPTLHDRWVETDTGWTITFGRGLDIFLPPPRAGYLDQTERECRATRFTYVKVR